MKMKVLLVNGSPHKEGCTYTALTEVAKTLNEESIDTDIFWIGIKPLAGCIACKKCAKTGRCAFDDSVNDFLDIAKDADGFIFGSPVHYAAASGAITSFMDRVFYANLQSGKQSFYLKPAAAVISARRAGTTATFDQLNKYFTISEMPIISSCYWNMVHGAKPEDVEKDLEGLQTMRILARNMAFFLKCKEIGLKTGVQLPMREERIFTNFIRE
jgi:multimeric flavodoxin WrbA